MNLFELLTVLFIYLNYAHGANYPGWFITIVAMLGFIWHISEHHREKETKK